jgi:hypothetical protein
VRGRDIDGREEEGRAAASRGEVRCGACGGVGFGMGRAGLGWRGIEETLLGERRDGGAGRRAGVSGGARARGEGAGRRGE